MVTTPTDASAADYARTMFEDGGNRAANDPRAQKAPRYNQAAHTGEAEIAADASVSTAVSATTFHSRDGTDAAGLFDEEGGPLGGTEGELDALEAGGTPVDRNPRMQD